MASYRVHIMISLCAAFVAALVIMGPLPQDPAYHNFADQRSIFGIPNFMDVVSNVPMFFIGIYGLNWSIRTINRRFTLTEKYLPLILCLGILTASFGSAYYHLSPDNTTLVWDRLPMTLMFMPLFALLIYDFISPGTGAIALLILVPLGILSVLYWHYTESIGQGDLRLYAFVQFFPMIAAPFILWLYPRKVPYIRTIIFILLWYTAAKIFEYYDQVVYNLSGSWSGHTIKHILGAVSLLYVIQLLKLWQNELTTS